MPVARINTGKGVEAYVLCCAALPPLYLLRITSTRQLHCERESFAACRRVQRAKQPCHGAASRTSRRRFTSSLPQVPLTAEGGSDFYAAPDRVRGLGPSCPAGSSGQSPRRRARGSRRAGGPGMDSLRQSSHRMVRPRTAILPLGLLHFCVMAACVAANSLEPSALDLQWTPSDTPARQVFPTQPQVRCP
jgi:hypothetical protein